MLRDWILIAEPFKCLAIGVFNGNAKVLRVMEVSIFMNAHTNGRFVAVAGLMNLFGKDDYELGQEGLSPSSFCGQFNILWISTKELRNNVKLLRWGCLLREIPCWIM